MNSSYVFSEIFLFEFLTIAHATSDMMLHITRVQIRKVSDLPLPVFMGCESSPGLVQPFRTASDGSWAGPGNEARELLYHNVAVVSKVNSLLNICSVLRTMT